jgi:hypothetical protein
MAIVSGATAETDKRCDVILEASVKVAEEVADVLLK